jgi:glycosyltransferase involved in cell wall biosynthesis
MPSPLVSIGLPAFNCEKTLAVAIRSILNQTYDNWELLLMEDGSSDGTLEVAARIFDPRISVLSDQSHKGLVSRLNQAVAICHGDYFARMDADDIAYPERLERQVEYLERHPEIDLLGCGMLVFRDDGIAQGCRTAPETHEEICVRPSDGFHIGHPTWMGRMSWFRTHSYDENAVRAEDQVLLLRSYATSYFACLPEILCGYREDKLALGKILRGRYGFATAAFGAGIQRKTYLNAIVGLWRQCGKAFLDTLAIVTGLNYAVLPHRARSLDPAGKQRWAEVWSQLHDKDAWMASK